MKLLRSKSWRLALATGVLLSATGCGVKSAPQAPELVRPAPITDLTAAADSHGIRLTWARPTHYTGGHTMRDLGGFVVMRGTGANGELLPLVVLPVTDQERFSVEREFSYIDTETTIGSLYRYEILSRTTDGYSSPPSNEVAFTRSKPAPPPNPDTFKLPSTTPQAAGS